MGVAEKIYVNITGTLQRKQKKPKCPLIPQSIKRQTRLSEQNMHALKIYTRLYVYRMYKYFHIVCFMCGKDIIWFKVKGRYFVKTGFKAKFRSSPACDHCYEEWLLERTKVL